MKRLIGIILSVGIALGLSAGAQAQSVVDWPPATGHMQFLPPSFPGPGAVGAQYVETFPSFAGMVEPQMAGAVQGGAYLNSACAAIRRTRQSAQASPARCPGTAAKARFRPPLSTRLRCRSGSFPGPAAAITPDYAPSSRYDSMESGYGRSPYGSSFYGGYYKGFPITGIPIYGE